MKDWTYRTRTFETPKSPLFVVPAGPVAETEQKRGFTVRVRGDVDGMVKHEYVCPVHGHFEAMVPRRDVPDRVRCKQISRFTNVETEPPTGVTEYDLPCGRSAHWAGSRCGIGVSAGYVES